MNRAEARHFPTPRSAGPRCRRPTTSRPRATRSPTAPTPPPATASTATPCCRAGRCGDIGHHDVSDHRFEQRGLLHVPVTWNGTRVHAIVAHFGLIHSQPGAPGAAARRVHRAHRARDEPLIVAGDFNDWGDKLDELMTDCGLARACVPGDPSSRVNTFPRAFRCSRWTASTSAASAASRPPCRAARPGRGCRTTCRWSRNSPSPEGLPTPWERSSQRPANPRPARRCVRGTRSTLLKGGEALFAALVQAIDAARAEVLLESYIFEFAGAPISRRRGAGARRGAGLARSGWSSTASAPATSRPSGRRAGRRPACSGGSTTRRAAGAC